MYPQDIYKIPFGVAQAYADRPEIQDIKDSGAKQAQAVMLAVSDLYDVDLPRKQSRRGRMRAPTTEVHYNGLREKGNFDVYPIVIPDYSLTLEEIWAVEATDETAAIRKFRGKTEKQPVLKFEVEEIEPTEYKLVTRGLESVNKVVYSVEKSWSSWEDEEGGMLFDTKDAALVYAESLALTTDEMIHVRETIVGIKGYANDIRLYREVSKKGVFEFKYQVPANLKKLPIVSYMAVLPHKGQSY